MSNFQREHRYFVIKLSSLDADLKKLYEQIFNRFETELVDCVVVEKDWPEYEPVWKMLEERHDAAGLPKYKHTVVIQRYKQSGKFYDDIDWHTDCDNVPDVAAEIRSKIDALEFSNELDYLITGEGFPDDKGYPHLIRFLNR